jgi:hypothetical protein
MYLIISTKSKIESLYIIYIIIKKSLRKLYVNFYCVCFIDDIFIIIFTFFY